MITTFNRREVLTTLSMKEQSQVKDILSQNHIKYHTKTVNHSRSGDIRTRGSTGIREDYAYESEPACIGRMEEWNETVRSQNQLL